MNSKSSEVRFKSKGYGLAGNIFESENGNNDAFLFLHGWKGRQHLSTAQSIADLGFTTMTYDMRGHGDSEGNLTEISRSDFVKDAGAAYDYLRQCVGNAATIGIVGNSFGSYAAALLTSERQVESLSLRAPSNYPDSGYYQPQLNQMSEAVEWRRQPLNFNQSMALRAIHAFEGKIQIIEAGNDEIVAPQTVDNYVKAVFDKKRLTYEKVQDSPHVFANEQLREDYTSRVVKWVRES